MVPHLHFEAVYTYIYIYMMYGKIKNVDTYSMKHMGYDIDILVGG